LKFMGEVCRAVEVHGWPSWIDVVAASWAGLCRRRHTRRRLRPLKWLKSADSFTASGSSMSQMSCQKDVAAPFPTETVMMRWWADSRLRMDAQCVPSKSPESVVELPNLMSSQVYSSFIRH
jgi:hypothetical protein